MKTRLMTGVILLLVLAPLIMIDVMFYLFQGLLGFFVLVAAYELLKMYESRKKFGINSKIVIMGCSLLTYLSAVYIVNTSSDGFNFDILFSVIILDIIAMLCLALFAKYDTEDVLRGIFTVMYSSFGMIALLVLRTVDVNFILYLLIVTSLTDVFAYFGGVTLGKHKMSPEISPKKTWEGAIIGSIVATTLGTIFVLNLGLNDVNIFALLLPELSEVVLIPIAIIVSLLISAAGQIGDLLASKIKREYGIKDYGSLFPGHGGVLDRFDSAIFVAMLMLSLLIMVL